MLYTLLYHISNESYLPKFVVAVVQYRSHVQLFATSWTAAYQASLSFTISQRLLKFMSIESVMQSTHLILCHPFLLLLPLFPNLLNMLHQIKETEWKKTEQNYNENMHRMKLQFFWSKIKVKASLVLKKKKKNFQISRFSGMSPFNISPSLGETSSGEWIWDSKVMSGWTLIVSRSLLQHQTLAENVKAEKHQSTAEGQNEPHLTETPAYWGGALGKFFSKKGTVSWKLLIKHGNSDGPNI